MGASQDVPGDLFSAFGGAIIQRVTDDGFWFHGYAWQRVDGAVDMVESLYGDRLMGRDASARGSVRLWLDGAFESETFGEITMGLVHHAGSVMAIDPRFSEGPAQLRPEELAGLLAASAVGADQNIDGTVAPGIQARVGDLTFRQIRLSGQTVTVVGSPAFTEGPLRRATSATPEERAAA